MYYHSRCVFVILVPSENVASIKKQAVVIEGVSRNRNVLIDGSTKNYDLESGYTCHQIGSGSITIQLAQPYHINSMRYSYLLHVKSVYLCDPAI